MLSVNQMNAQIKLGEVWKSIHTTGYPTTFENQKPEEGRSTTRVSSKGRLIETGKNPYH